MQGFGKRVRVKNRTEPIADPHNTNKSSPLRFDRTLWKIVCRVGDWPFQLLAQKFAQIDAKYVILMISCAGSNRKEELLRMFYFGQMCYTGSHLARARRSKFFDAGKNDEFVYHPRKPDGVKKQICPSINKK